MAKITGTFIDEITVDIGSQNWSADDWRRDFEAMAYIGIDTVVIIRGGLRDQAVFPSDVVGNHDDPDLAQLFLDEAARHDMRLFFGTYDSGLWPAGGVDARTEAATSVRFIGEVLARYGGHPALKGWYICQEVCRNTEGANELFKRVATHVKEKTPELPTLISPFYPGTPLGEHYFLKPEQFGDSWRELIKGLTGLIDIAAFQDGTTSIEEYPSYLAVARDFTQEASIEFWNNVETFSRQHSYCFPPRDIRVLTRRLNAADPYASKHITFEFSHFMSPNSSFPGAANLYKRYCETILGT